MSDAYEVSPRSSPEIRRVRSVTAGSIAFAGSWLAGLVAVVLLIRRIPFDESQSGIQPGFADAASATLLFITGAGLSFLIAVVVGCVVATWIAYRDLSRVDPRAPLD